jgi:hypothetical protein
MVVYPMKMSPGDLKVEQYSDFALGIIGTHWRE